MSKKIVVTGATRGLGRALVEGFIKGGNQVFGCGRSEKGVNELQSRFSDHIFNQVDVSNFKEVERWAKSIEKEFGAPDILINNAGIINSNAPLWELDVEEVRMIFDVNIQGVFHCIRAFLPAMIDKESGIVINLSSGWGRSTSPEVAPYCASKWAIEGLSKSLAQELPRGMASIPLNPGVINTEMLQSCFGPSADSFPDAKEWAEKAVPYILAISPGDNGQSLTVPQ
ncbi:MAG: SDR family NAD(P)-dependent oxidoreductase [Verrucomicrobia bacterium]|nr:SDR family NAD(P)-dependent oxidoreductase [Verrucomicrobiota bacterium]MDA1067784.1 SDR family NAD(P)-dependent oxidoreductase [Verrucomicrobiota bacterium]